MPYYEHKNLISQVYRILKKGGFTAFISNITGTLSGIVGTYIKVMSKNPDYVDKVMDTNFHLPKNVKTMNRWFKEFDLKTYISGEGEEVVYFDNGYQLIDWLKKTGAVAGTENIFSNKDRIIPQIVKEIERRNTQNGKTYINHKFAYGVYIK